MSTESYVFQRVISEVAPILEKAEGMYITVQDPKTGEERVIIDAMTGAAVGSLGHQDLDIVQAMCNAAKTSNYAFGYYLGNRASEDLSKFIIDNSPENHFASCLWVGSGSEANENAMKIVKQYHLERNDSKRYRYISRYNSYHGFTIGALSVGDGIRKVDFKDILLSEEQTPKVSACYPFRGIKEGMTEEDYTNQLLKELEDKFIECDPSTVAACFFETVGGRNGKYHCYESFMKAGSGPDIMTVGKTIGSGYVTLAGVLISPKVKDAVVAGSNKANGAQTYHCHEFNCKVGLEVQKKLLANNYPEKGAEVGKYMMEKIAENTKTSKVVGDIRGLPLFFSIEFCDPTTKEHLVPQYGFAYKVQEKCLRNNITSMAFQGTCGSYTDEDGNIVALGDHISLAPAYIITFKEADIIVDALVKSIEEAEVEYLAAEK
ncbi:hypothetical protein C6P42_000580 [Pichia californica]|nr:hypothetical protein C6P42_000580 [[Candida] californica]